MSNPSSFCACFTGRIVTAEFADFFAVCVYVPNAGTSYFYVVSFLWRLGKLEFVVEWPRNGKVLLRTDLTTQFKINQRLGITTSH